MQRRRPTRPAIPSKSSRPGPKSTPPRRKIIGLARFDSGLCDLATNPKYMEHFGLTRSEILAREQKQS